MQCSRDVAGSLLPPIRRALPGTPTRSAREAVCADVIAGGPQGSHAFTNDARFVEWLGQVADFNRQHGMRELRVVSVHHVTLSPLHTLATVVWGARFEKTGDRVIEFDISYLLEQTADGWQILTYISRADQNEEMAKAGLL